MKKIKIPIMQMLASIAIIILSWLPVIINQGQSYTVFQLFLGNIKMMNPIIPIQVSAVLLAITPIEYLIHVIFLIKNSHDKYEDIILYTSLLTTVIAITFMVLCGLQSSGKFTIWIWIRILLILTSFWLDKMFISFQEFKITESLKNEDKKLEDEKKMDISTRNISSRKNIKAIRKNPYLKKIMWKIYKNNIRNSILLLVGATISSAFLFTTIAVYEEFYNLQKGKLPVVGNELSLLLRDAIILIGIISIFILAVSLKIYVKSRIKDYNLMINLGIKDKILRQFISIEYIGNLVLGLIIGVLLGSICTIMFESVIDFIYPNFVVIKIPTIGTYLIGCFYIILLFVFSTFVNSELYTEMELGTSRQTEVSREKIPNRWLKVKCIVGIILILFSSYLFSKPVWTESIYLIILFLIGCYILMSVGAAFILKSCKEKEKSYYKRLPLLQQFYSRFKTERNNFFIIFIIHFVLIAYVSVQISTLISLINGDVLFPYDYVCLGEKDDKKVFQQLDRELCYKSLIIPMVRITVASASEKNKGSTMDTSFQGQNIGISESSYKKLTGKKLGLRNKEIVISFQQDKSRKSHLLDFSVICGSPRIRFGMPEDYFMAERDSIFKSDYKVVKQERRIIIGNLLGGMQENIIVFSDEYFKSIYGTSNGPTILALFNINENKKEEATKKFADYSKTHMEYSKYDSVIHSVYEKEYLQNNTLLINVLKLLEYIFVAILLLISLLYVFIVKIISELKETRVRMKKLKYLGMKEKLYRKILGFENNIIKIIPLVFGILGGIIYIFITFKIRYFTKIEQQQFWKYEMCIISIYIIIYLIVSFIISRINMWLVDKGE